MARASESIGDGDFQSRIVLDEKSGKITWWRRMWTVHLFIRSREIIGARRSDVTIEPYRLTS